MNNDDKDITLHDVVNHMSHHFQLIDKQFAQIDKRFSELEAKIDRNYEEYKKFKVGVEDLDFRVQDIEEKNLDQRVTKLEAVATK